MSMKDNKLNDATNTSRCIKNKKEKKTQLWQNVQSKMYTLKLATASDFCVTFFVSFEKNGLSLENEYNVMWIWALNFP